MNMHNRVAAKIVGVAWIFATTAAMAGGVTLNTKGILEFANLTAGKTTYPQLVAELGPPNSKTDDGNYITSAQWWIPKESVSTGRRVVSSGTNSLVSKIESSAKSSLFSRLKSRVVSVVAASVPGVGGQIATNVVSQVSEGDLTHVNTPANTDSMPDGWMCTFYFEHGRYSQKTCGSGRSGLASMH